MLAFFCVAALLQLHEHRVVAADAGGDHAAASLVLPVSGFISAIAEDDDLALRILRKVNAPASCRTVEFKGIPATELRKITGGATFQLLEGRSYNERPAWSNGKEFISYVTKDAPFGNWLVGNDPGVDGGYMYIGTAAPSLTPLGLEGLKEEPSSGGKGRLHWLALQTGSWNEHPGVQLQCTDTPAPPLSAAPSSFVEVEYFDHAAGGALRSSFLALARDVDPALLPPMHPSHAEPRAEPRAALFHAETGSWELLSSVCVVAEMGAPTVISELSSVSSDSDVRGGGAKVALLVNAEHSGSQGWRCTFRHYPLSPPPVARSEAASAGRHSAGIDTLHYQPSHWTERPQHTLEQREEDESEYSVLLGTGSGVLETQLDGRGVQLAPLPRSRQHEIASAIQASLAAVVPGDFVWLWLSPASTPVGSMHRHSTAIGVSGDAITASSASASASASAPPHTEAVDELLVRCRSRSNSTLVFDFFPSDRREQMKQTMLDRNTQFLTVQLPYSEGGLAESAGPAVAHLAGQPMSLRSALYLGADVLEYLRRYLIRKELFGTLGLSACYLYHAAVSMPQSLIYAAEIMCVLIGAKPVTMVR
jgi:hypothetical protein